MASVDDNFNSFLDSEVINDEFFMEIVAKKLNIKCDQFKLRLVLLTPAAGKNENFVCQVHRVKIKVELFETKTRQNVDVILKALCTKSDHPTLRGVFKRERLVYESILGNFETIWLEAGEIIQFGPKCLKVEQESIDVLVLEDLKSRNFEMADRRVGLNLEQTKLVLKKLAKFHAASVVHYQRNKQIDECLTRSGIGSAQRSIPIFIKALKAYGNCDEFAEKISKWNLSKLSSCCSVTEKPMKNGFAVLNHGDLWVNNLMMTLDDVIFIDFQMQVWTSPSIDLFYFLITSVEDGIKVKHFDEFLQFYHHELTASLVKLKFDQIVPSLDELYDDILEKGSYVLLRMMFILSIVKHDSPEALDMAVLTSGSDEGFKMLTKCYQNENYRKALTAWLPFLDKRGFLDTLL